MLTYLIGMIINDPEAGGGSASGQLYCLAA